MRTISLETPSGRSIVAVGESIGRLAQYCNAARGVVVTDTVVRSLHGERFPGWPVVEIGTGEGAKTLETAMEIYRAFLRHEVDRSSLVVAIGGGIVCDVAGFAASTFLRGLPFGFVPTTLLAQVDASVGGKNGVNLLGYKNLVGTFTQPAFVLCDLDLLRTLPEAEVRNGLAEVVKQAAVSDEGLFAFLEANSAAALRLEPGVIDRIVHDALKAKIGIVSGDEREKGERRKLNFGHTIGHAVEKVHAFRHGEAVALGMKAAARLSVAMGLLSPGDEERIGRLLAAFGLPKGTEIDAGLVGDALRKDKKREGGRSISSSSKASAGAG